MVSRTTLYSLFRCHFLSKVLPNPTEKNLQPLTIPVSCLIFLLIYYTVSIPFTFLFIYCKVPKGKNFCLLLNPRIVPGFGVIQILYFLIVLSIIESGVWKSTTLVVELFLPSVLSIFSSKVLGLC